ncbi:uncharacterized protein LOC125889110 [Epinephelus fuscoguttatus]|uniref:uncharacterized protein LOC125889110 n=1 Tax=Epinephelus fuscoguttatus TaxID=293821 RepID=UPI0020D0DA1A|nr:uncharacterized protein LOC125889110 [Epinephelus fuscoguttatus]
MFMCVSSEEICRRKWKGLRDTYLKEKKKERERKSGLAGTGGKRWKYSAVLSFLDPFVTPKETSGNMRVGVEEEDRTAEYTQDEGPVEDQGSNAAAAEPSDVDMGDMPDHSCDSSEAEPAPAAAAASPAAAAASTAIQPPRARKRTNKRSDRTESDRRSEIEALLVATLRRPQEPAPPPPSDDELFLRSLVPALQRLSPQQKEFVKFQIHKLIYESSTLILNLEPVE